MNPRRPRGSSIVWVPVGTNLLLVGLAWLLDDPTAVALTSVSAVVGTGAVVAYVRESGAQKDHIAHLQAAIPTLSSPLSAEDVLNMTPKPSPVVTEVLKQAAPAALTGSAPVALPTEPIDRS